MAPDDIQAEDKTAPLEEAAPDAGGQQDTAPDAATQSTAEPVSVADEPAAQTEPVAPPTELQQVIDGLAQMAARLTTLEQKLRHMI